MESLLKYINESLRKTDIDDFEDIVYSVIDYVYNEEITLYDSKHLNEYINGDKEPNYKEIVDIAINKFKKLIPAKILYEIKKYPKTSYKEDFELAILNAIDKYMKSIKN